MMLPLTIMLCLHFLVLVRAASPKVVPMRFQHRQASRDMTEKLSKRNYFSTVLENYMPLGLYYATVGVGTPPQTLELAISTGSSDIWFFSPPACNSSGCEGGSCMSFVVTTMLNTSNDLCSDNSNASSTYHLLGKNKFSLAYDTAGSGVRGDYVSDVFEIGGITVQNLTMACANQVNVTLTGFLGIGLQDDEAQNMNYPNLPQLLVNQGIISSKSYSIYLDDFANQYGSIIFGGYDPSKYWNNLFMLPIQSDSSTGKIESFQIAWTSFSVTYNGTVPETYFLTSSDFPVPAIMESSTTFTYVPQDIFNTVAQAFKATYDNTTDLWAVPCTNGISATTFNFGFGGPGGTVVPVPDSELTFPCYYENGNRCTINDTIPMCWFGLQPTVPGRPLIFGQTFLRSAYVLYDLDKMQVGIAPTVFNSNDSFIAEYNPSGGNNHITTYTAGPTITAYSSVANGSVALATSKGAPFAWTAIPYDPAPPVEAPYVTAIAATGSQTSTTSSISTTMTSQSSSSTSSNGYVTFGTLPTSSSTAVTTSIYSGTTSTTASAATTSAFPGAAAGLVMRTSSGISIWICLGTLALVVSGMAFIL